MMFLSSYVLFLGQRHIFYRDIELQRTSAGQARLCYGIAFFICACGGTPNAYQALVLDNEWVWIVVMSALAPLLVEIYGYQALLANSFAPKSKSAKSLLIDIMEQQFQSALVRSDVLSENRKNRYCCHSLLSLFKYPHNENTVENDKGDQYWSLPSVS